jgi:3,4-dihydroxy 2-butanone 4-phosphate synthase/GTP cyclohydrolase II
LPYRQYLSSIDEIIEDARKGKMIILVDEEDRENEGDLLIPAELADAEAINFMAKHGRGLICLALTGERVGELGLPLMSQQNLSRHQTAFTVSIEAREGVTTGISAADRARTVAVAIDPERGREDIASPGHVFPLVARDGGVLVRAGHTEAAIDIARLAGFNPSGVICEIMNDDGTMARLPDLVQFAQLHGLKIATIADLIAYRRRHDTIVDKVVEAELDTIWGGVFRAAVYINNIEYAEHLALVKGDISGPDPVLVRVHAFNFVDDVLGDRAGPRGVLREAVRQIDAEGRGVVVLIREPRRTSLSDYLELRAGGPPKGGTPELRDYGIGAQILLDLGVREMILLSNSQRTIVGLDGYGLSVVERRPIPTAGEDERE